ncbi:hypothetical protein MSAN_00384100 [Mycena sanguinolenta]|uniref:Uncharacterized protein n=1 Tax=Mycena sanguinolenta TaxID=230812 RepID=A0A8H7DHY1_9AGAR|nr:hypothetical protein MSAN_00384100 [Mycena sanguinolenta]
MHLPPKETLQLSQCFGQAPGLFRLYRQHHFTPSSQLSSRYTRIPPSSTCLTTIKLRVIAKITGRGRCVLYGKGSTATDVSRQLNTFPVCVFPAQVQLSAESDNQIEIIIFSVNANYSISITVRHDPDQERPEMSVFYSFFSPLDIPSHAASSATVPHCTSEAFTRT